jgi:regulatory protein
MARAPQTLRARALRLLAAREHSRAELARKLGPHAESRDELAALLDDLQERQQLSDARYAEARSGVLARKFGSARIAQDLKAKGVSEEEAASVVAAARTSDLERARAVWTRKFRVPPVSREERAKQARFLQARGFSFDVIKAVLAGAEEDEKGAT